MPAVELIYDRDCPNVGQARTNLLRAFVQAGRTPRWSEHLTEDPAAMKHTRGYGSPTILIDGHDISGAAPDDGASCRLYLNEEGRPSRVPAVSQIAAALSSAFAAPRSRQKAAGWQSTLAVVPGVGAALLPKVACPACWPAYAGFLSSIGLGLLTDSTWLFPVTGAFLALAVSALVFRARARRGYGPFGLGVMASAIVLLGKFAFESDSAMYAGIGLLVAASLWNSWPRQQGQKGCPACATSR